jgi:hypothetical protein
MPRPRDVLNAILFAGFAAAVVWSILTKPEAPIGTVAVGRDAAAVRDDVALNSAARLPIGALIALFPAKTYVPPPAPEPIPLESPPAPAELPTAAEATEPAPEMPPEPEPVDSEDIRFVGRIGDAGGDYFFFRDAARGKLYEFPLAEDIGQDGIVEIGDGFYILRIEGALYRVYE